MSVDSKSSPVTLNSVFYRLPLMYGTRDARTNKQDHSIICRLCLYLHVDGHIGSITLALRTLTESVARIIAKLDSTKPDEGNNEEGIGRQFAIIVKEITAIKNRLGKGFINIR